MDHTLDATNALAVVPDPEGQLAEVRHALRPAVPLSPRTGEPRRPWLVVAASVLLHAGWATLLVGLLWTMWLSVRRFPFASRLHALYPTEIGSWWRVAMVTGETLATVLMGGLAAVTAHYAWKGYRWARWAGLVTIATLPLAWFGTDLQLWGAGAVALGSLLLFLPPVRRFFGQWRAVRHPEPPAPVVVSEVYYGPLPRFRAPV